MSVSPRGWDIYAQTQGDYIISVRADPPYRMDRQKRFEGSHFVRGYPIGIDCSSDGRFLVSGSSDGRIAIYDVKQSHCVKSFDVSADAIVDVSWHPFLPSNIAAACWDGSVHLLK